ncbi:MAG: response regulator, partial [Rhizobiales bacterium]|nr:response regulator [Hyphomicrobiales bacterium]
MARILVTEDDDAVRMFVSRALMLDGHEVLTAEDGEDALDVLIRENGQFDLLLTDIKMPIMDGIALTHAAASQYRDLLVISILKGSFVFAADLIRALHAAGMAPEV